MENQDQKKDGGKPKMSRFPLRACVPVVRVLEFGKWKYGKWGGWQEVDNAEERYTDALFRHVADLQEFGLRHVDAESGLPTLAHAVCDAVFLLWFTVKTDPGQPWLKRAEEPVAEKCIGWSTCHDSAQPNCDFHGCTDAHCDCRYHTRNR